MDDAWTWDADADTWRLPLGDIELRVQPGEHGFDWQVAFGFAVLANDRHASLQAARAAAMAWVREASHD
jgi:hypothetical protein